MERFEACGDKAWILVDPANANRVRVAASRCHDRFCEACAAEKRRLVGVNVAKAIRQKHAKLCSARRPVPLRFVTLTLRGSSAALATCLDRLYDSWTKLRNRKAWRERVEGGIAFLEITRSDKTGAWHPHLHILCEGQYLPHDLLSKLWHEVTGDSYIVDVRAIKTPDTACAYIAKYAAKALNSRVWTDPDALCEAIAALEGRRCFNCFGSWKDLGLTQQPDDDTEWQVVGTWADVQARANGGDEYARALLSRIAAGGVADVVDAPETPG
ncbi:hypothetical protein GF348_24280 [candidate division KSB3 bacterium]|nr:hypothetical protein [candidate division KSB3 bacterium]